MKILGGRRQKSNDYIRRHCYTKRQHTLKKRPGVRPYVPPEMAEGDFRLMMYQTTVQWLTIKTPNNVRVWILYIYIQYYLHAAHFTS